MANVVACPDAYALQNLVSGKLFPAEQESLLVHLESCPSCVQRMQTLSGADTLVEVMRSLDTATLEEDGPAVARIIEQLLAPAQNPEGTQAEEPVSGPDATDANYGFLAPAQGPDEIGRLGGYRVLKVLGAGGMGIVFQAEDLELGRLVALKVIKPERAAQAHARERFRREARAAAALDHDHIVHIYQVGEDRGIQFLATQLLEGMSLEQWLARNGKPSIVQVLRIGKQIALGLAAAHARGLIHRDIKPGNLWLEDRSGKRPRLSAAEPTSEDACGHEFRVKILDFGLARTAASGAELGEPLTQSGAIMGTPAYMAPEQARGLVIDHRADLFSLGCVLYELTTGERPFKGPDPFAVLTSLAVDTPPTPQRVNIDVPAGLSALIVQLMEKDPARRPASAQDVVNALVDLESSCMAATRQRAAGFTPAVTPLAPTSRNVVRGRRRIPILAAVGLLVASFTIAILFGGQIIRFATNQAELVIEVDDPAIEVKIVQNGVVVHDKTGKREFTLTAGNGEIEVMEKNGIKLATKRFELTRGGTTTVTVTLQELANARKPNDPDRKAAGWVLSIGGTIKVKENGQQRQIAADGDLPRGAFELTVVILFNNQKATDPGLAHFKYCKNLTDLELSQTSVGDAGLAHFTNCKNLTVLGLVNTQVSNAGLAHFKNCKYLTDLALHNTQVSDAGLAHFKNCEYLTYLGLGDTAVTDAGLAYFKNCKNLRGLSLENTQVSDAGLAHFKDCKYLTRLSLTSTQVTDAGLAHLKDCKNLEHVHLNNTKVSDAGLAYLAQYTRLDSLNLKKTKVTEAGVKKLAAALPECTIEWDGPMQGKAATDSDRKAAEWVLSIGGTIKIKENGKEREIKAVGDLPRGAFELTLVFLGDNPSLNDAALARLKDCHNLSWLDLSETQVSDAGLAALKDCKKLTTLVLDRTPITDAGLAHLKECKTLTQLYLVKSKVTAAGVALLKKALPKCAIEWVSPDRKAAEWVISIGGRVMVRMEDGIRIDWVSKLAKNALPAEDWVLAYIQLGGKQLGNQKVTDGGLAHFKRLTHLEYLELENTRISDRGLKHLYGLTKLVSITLKGTKVTSAGVAALQKALPKCSIDWDGDTSDRSAAEWVLSIGGSIKIKENGKERQLGVVDDLPREAFDLTAVDLHGRPRVSDAGLAHFKDYKNLVRLDLSQTIITDAGIKHLAGLAKLESLDLRGTKVSAAGVADLQKALPNCKIVTEK